MFKVLRTHRLAAGLALALVAPARAGHEHFPNSSWALDIAHSALGAGPKVKSDIVTLGADNERWLSYAEVAVGASGKITKLSWDGAPDGSVRPMNGMPGAVAGFVAADDSGHFIYPNGTSVSNRFWMSHGRNTLTYRVVGFTNVGKEFRQTLVYHRIALKVVAAPLRQCLALLQSASHRKGRQRRLAQY